MDRDESPVDAEEAVPLLESRRSLSSTGINDTVHKSKLAGVGIRGALLGSSYLVLSTGMILYNKHMMRKDRFPFAPFIVLTHIMVTSVMAAFLLLMRRDFFPMAESVLRQEELIVPKKQGKRFADNLLSVLVRFFPIGALGATSLALSTSAYRYNTVSELQMVKETSVFMVWLFSVIAGLETPQLRNACVLVCVTICAMLAVCGETHMLMRGLALQAIASICQSIQIVLTSCMMSHVNGPKIDPLTMVLCTAPAMLFVLLPINYAFWDPIILVRLIHWWPQLLASAVVAFVLQIITATAIRELSATGLQLVSVAKDLVIVASAAYLLHEHLTNIQLFGFAGAITGISVYSWLKLSAARA